MMREAGEQRRLNGEAWLNTKKVEHKWQMQSRWVGVQQSK